MLKGKKNRAHSVMVDEADPGWHRFWDAYPKRVSKREARKAWAQVNPSPEIVDRMLTTLAWQCRIPDWVKDGGQFIPHPASWLRGARWDDEPIAVTASGRTGAPPKGKYDGLGE